MKSILKQLSCEARIAIFVCFAFVIFLVVRLLSGYTILDAERSYTPDCTYNLNVSRNVNTAFKVSSLRKSEVWYNVTVTNSATVVAGSSGQVLLETKTGAGSWTTICSGNPSIGLGVVVTVTAVVTLHGPVNRDDSVRIRTNTITGSPTYGSAGVGWEKLVN